MATQDNIRLSPSEKLTLRYVADGELHASELDWIALQRLKQAGLLQARPSLASLGRSRSGPASQPLRTRSEEPLFASIDHKHLQTRRTR